MKLDLTLFFGFFNLNYFNIFRFDYDKFSSSLSELRQGLQKQIDQWYQYEQSLQQLVSWLNDVESTLKNYAELSTLDEKQEQLTNYMVSYEQFL